eukprot:TRINITY_DN15448_c0_g1_i1.p2 TRINITY_DN15448_c0_g1~~TRINITY_DN15448_c0_g1_i1.p2  ORF type:complete len:82 (-),score=6.26 TRINITY_DN15448_c0_g1_i1:174-419(-)
MGTRTKKQPPNKISTHIPLLHNEYCLFCLLVGIGSSLANHGTCMCFHSYQRFMKWGVRTTNFREDLSNRGNSRKQKVFWVN